MGKRPRPNLRRLGEKRTPLRDHELVPRPSQNRLPGFQPVDPRRGALPFPRAEQLADAPSIRRPLAERVDERVVVLEVEDEGSVGPCLLYTSPSPRDS